MFVYGVQSALCCTEIMYSTIFLSFYFAVTSLQFVQFVLLLYRNTVQHSTNVLPCSNELVCTATAVMWPFYKFTNPLTQVIQKEMMMMRNSLFCFYAISAAAFQAGTLVSTCHLPKKDSLLWLIPSISCRCLPLFHSASLYLQEPLVQK